MTKILSNQIKCLKCGDTPYSSHRHDCASCKCGECFVDGGMDYFRYGAKDMTNLQPMGIEVEDELYDVCIKEIEWCEETGRNSLGVLCAITRAIRDSGYKIVKNPTDDE